MNYRIALLTTVTLVSFALPSIAAAQSAKDVVGTWTLVSAEITMPDGEKTPGFGTKPTGMLVFTEDGHFIYLYTRSDLPKIASASATTPGRAGGALRTVAMEWSRVIRGLVAAKKTSNRMSARFPVYSRSRQTRGDYGSAALAK
jgi:Lipocalin-like domain